MFPFRKFRGLLSRAAEDWRDALDALFPTPRTVGQRPLRIMRLERRRVLNADFALVGGSLVLDGFDAAEGDTLTITQTADEYRFASTSGWEGDSLPDGFSLDGQTLTADRAAVDALPGGVVTRGVDVSYVIAGGSSSFATPPTPMIPTGGLTLSSLSVAGDLSLFSNGPINDGPGTRLTVTGDATFTSRGAGGINLADDAGDALIVGGEATFDAIDGATRLDISIGSAGRVELGDVTALGGQVAITERAATRIDRVDATDFALTSAGVIDTTAGATIEVTGDASLTSTSTFNPADYNDDGVVDTDDQVVWSANFGSSGAGDGNGDGVVDLADYTLWRDRVGEVETPGGVTIVDAATFHVGGLATLVASDAQGDYDILVGPDPSVQFGSLGLVGANVQVTEDAGGSAEGTALADVMASQLSLVSDGPITDEPGAVIAVSGSAVVRAEDADITLDNASVNFGDIGLFGDTVVLREASGTLLSDTLVAGELSITSAGRIEDLPNAAVSAFLGLALEAELGVELADAGVQNTLFVGPMGPLVVRVGDGQDISLGVDTNAAPLPGEVVRDAEADFSGTAGVSLFAPNGVVRVAKDDTLSLSGDSQAGVLLLQSDNQLIDSDDASVVVSGDASFRATEITLADGPTADNRLMVDGLARFEVDAGENIDLGVDASGAPADAVFVPGTLSFAAPAGRVRVAVDSSAALASSNVAGSLRLDVDGAVTDTAGAVLTVTGDAVIDAAGAVTLDNDQVNFGTLGVTGTDVLIREASGTNLSGVDAATFDLVAQGPVVDDPGAVIAVSGSAVIGDPGMLGDVITLDNPSVNFGDIGLNGTDVLLREASATAISSIQALSLDLVSAGEITDLPDAVIFVEGRAQLEGALGVTLADGGADNDVLIGLFDFATVRVGAGQTISLGVDPSQPLEPGEILPDADASFRGPALQLLAPGGLARVSDDTTVDDFPSAFALVGRNEAETLLVQSASSILDTDGADFFPATDTEVSGDASFRAAAGIFLADGTTTDNRLLVGGLARFEVDAGENIDVGVDADGAPADAVFVPGTLSFAAPDGRVRVAVDSAAVLASSNLASSLRLDADGAITDTAGADTEVTRAAELVANGGAADVVLGDESARFSLGAPTLFSPDEFLAIAAHNVSVQADSAVNVRTAPVDSAFGGTFHLAATGTIAQVGDQAGDLQPLTAERVSLDSEGAVLFSEVALTSADDLPNLQVRAGESVDLVSDFDDLALQARFNLDAIPSSQETSLSPAVVEADLADGSRPGQPARIGAGGQVDAGLEDVLVNGQPSRLGERAPEVGPAPTGFGTPVDIGDAYAAIVRVSGDAIVGDVSDATGAAADAAIARGVAVTSTGSAFLETTGSLEFTGRGRFDSSASVDVVSLAGGVLTAVAGTTLSIDTEEGDQPDPTKRTTRLRSATGAVTSIAPGDQSGLDASPGPRVLLDTPTEAGDAATTGLLRAEQDFEQRITAAIGSRGEDNLLVEVEWADVATVRNQSAATVNAGVGALRPSFDSAEVAGSREFADLIQTPVESIETAPLSPGLDFQDLGGPDPGDSFRVVTITHNYLQPFLPANPAQDSAPTTVRVFNDPAINLFDQGGARDLNSATLTVAPRIITLPPSGFFIISTPEQPTVFAPREMAFATDDPTSTPLQTARDDARAVVASSAETVEFGRVDASGEWMQDIPGETWPQIREDAEGDFLREVRDQIDEGPYSEGRYRIQIRTPRGEQLLEEWIKTDSGAEEPSAEEALIEEAREAAPEAADADAAPAVYQGAGPVQAEPASEDASPTPTVAAAIAAVGAWRGRLNASGRFRADAAHGVVYTRAQRRRRTR